MKRAVKTVRGASKLTFQDEKDGDRRRKTDVVADGQAETRRAQARKQRLPASDVGDALKTVYQRAISEDIPPEMLDLLGKLG